MNGNNGLDEVVLDGYSKEKLTFNFLRLNILCIIILIVSSVVFGGLFFGLWPDRLAQLREAVAEGKARQIALLPRLLNAVIILVVFLVSGVVHELIHGLFYAVFAEHGFKSIKFGVILKKGIAYCVCADILKTKHTVVVGAMPAVLQGFVPIVVSLCSGWFGLLLYGVVMLATAVGDFEIFFRLLKEKPDYTLDSPDGISIFIFKKMNG